MNRLTTSLSKDFSKFFFKEEVPYGLAITRIWLPIVILLDMVPRWFHAREFYSLDGALAPLQVNYGFPNMLPAPSGLLAVILASVLIFTLCTTAIGWKSRLSSGITAMIYVYLTLMDCMGTMTKYTVIASHILLLLTLSDCGSVWSVDSILRRRRELATSWQLPGSSGHRKSAVWPRRLMQLLIGIVYIGAAFTKMHTAAFFSSDQMRSWMLTNVNSANPVGEWLSFYPGTLVISAYITIIWEVLFVFLAWRGWGRISMIGLGVVFHLGTTILLGLYIFPLVCYSTYFAFLSEHDVQRIASWVRRLARRGNKFMVGLTEATSRLPSFVPSVSPRMASGAFAAGILVVAVAGVEAEHQLDPFQERGASGKLKLEEMNADLVRTMVVKSPRIRESDKYLSFDIGSELFGDLLVNHRNVFRIGDTIVAQCTLTHPHEDMWIECNLHDADDRLIDRVGQVIDRSTLRSNYAYEVRDSLEPGTYFLVVRSGGQEITRRAFTVLPAGK